MTPRERAEAAKNDWIGDGTGWLDTELKELQDIIEDAITEHVRVVLAPNKSDWADLCRAANISCSGIEAARLHNALAALCRKAGI
jgi:hypothetical protein